MDILNRIPIETYAGAAGGVASWFTMEGGDLSNSKHAARAILSRVVVAGAIGAGLSYVLPMVPLPPELLNMEPLLAAGAVYVFYGFAPTSIKAPVTQVETTLYNNIFGAFIKG